LEGNRYEVVQRRTLRAFHLLFHIQPKMRFPFQQSIDFAIFYLAVCSIDTATSMNAIQADDTGPSSHSSPITTLFYSVRVGMHLIASWFVGLTFYIRDSTFARHCSIFMSTMKELARNIFSSILNRHFTSLVPTSTTLTA